MGRFNRISENVLFALLLAASVGWVTVPVAADLQSASPANPAFVAPTQVHRL